MYLKFIFTFFALNCIFLTNCEDIGDLVFAHVLFRHGDRTPVDPYPTDPWRNQSYWPVPFGQLTNTGKRQHYELGKWLRNRYNSLVGETYSYDKMYVQSTDIDRTLMSAMSNLAGFYPPKGGDVWNKDLLWEPIPVHTTPLKSDEVLAAKKSCPAYDRLLKELKKSDEFKALDREYQPMYHYLTLHSGRKVHSIQDVEFLYNCLFIEDLYNKTLPDWTKKYYPEKMMEIGGLAFAIDTYTKPLARLKSGPLLLDILNRFKSKSTSTLNPDRNLWIYSAHDTTVANLLSILGLFKQMGYHSPPYRSTVLLELRKRDGQYFVQVFYKNTTADPEPQNIPDCGTLCPLDKMFELYNDVLPENWEKECNPGTNALLMPLFKNEIETSLGMFVLVSMLLFVVLLVVLLGVFYRRRYIMDDRWYLRI